MLTMDKIKQAVVPLAEKYDIVKVDLFGSYATGTATEKSDVDFLVLFNADIPTIYNVMGFKAVLPRLRKRIKVRFMPDSVRTVRRV